MPLEVFGNVLGATAHHLVLLEVQTIGDLVAVIQRLQRGDTVA